MPNLVWLASYPKSGNTWMRAFLTAYLAGPGAEIDLNDLDASLHAANRQLFDRVVGFPSSDLSPAEIDSFRADVYRAFDAEADGPLFLKTHDAWRRTPDGKEVFPADATRLAVLIVRNPLAVAPSYAHHYSMSIDDAIDRMADPSLALAGQVSRLVRQLPQPMGTWSQHAQSWLDQPDIPTLMVRYEDLRAQPADEFSRILTACGLPVDGAAIADALERTSFDRLQSAEAAGGFRERLPGAEAFFRRGRVDGWRDELTDEQVRRIVAAHGPMMARLGYAPGMAETWTTPHLTQLDVSMDTAAPKNGSNSDGTLSTAIVVD